jgi:hypothetical protein
MGVAIEHRHVDGMKALTDAAHRGERASRASVIAAQRFGQSITQTHKLPRREFRRSYDPRPTGRKLCAVETKRIAIFGGFQDEARLHHRSHLGL